MRAKVVLPVIAAILILGLSQSAFAANYNEIEQVGLAENNILANAEPINPALFTTPEPTDVFQRQGSVTATILGQAGFAVLPESVSSTTPGDKVTAQGDQQDADWYSFTTIGSGNNIFMADVDDASGAFGLGDSFLQLYDGNGFPVALGDDSFPEDPGTTFGFDSFIGQISLSPGTYFIAINSCCEFSVVDVFDCVSDSPLTRPDGEFGGSICNGPPGAANPEITANVFNPGGSEPYTLHLSLLQILSVGGELIPLDTTSLLVGGAQMNAAWMIPVIISAIGIGIVIARKF